MLNRFVVVDLETTGTSPKSGEKIIQFAAVVVENGKISDAFSSLINPHRPIPPFIEELTGINDQMVKNAPVFSEIASDVMSLLKDSYFVAHNVLFDLSFLQEELLQSGCKGFYGPVVDTVELARIFFPTADGYKLTDLAEQENLQHSRPHQADSDAYATAELLQILLDKMEKLPRDTIWQLSRLSRGLKSDVHQLLDELLVEKDQKIEELPDSIEIFQGLAIRKYEEAPFLLTKEVQCVYPESEQEKTLRMEKILPSFEKRTGQFEMMDDVYDSFQNNCHSLIEAGTGVGKSLGYLLPAAYFSKETGQRVIISTHTIHLQEQLIRKEVPLLVKLVPFSVQAAILKGKEHYISLEKFYQTLFELEDNYDFTLTKMQILIWLLETETGDKDQLNLSSGGQIFWNKIKSSKADSSPRKGNWIEKDFYARAKRKADRADIIITNHSLLLSDMTAKNSRILPDYEYAVIDEGHHFGKVASQFLGRSLDYLGVRLLLGQLGVFEQKQLYYQFEKLVESLQLNTEGLPHSFEVNQLIADLIYEVDEFFKFVILCAKKNTANKKEFRRFKIRFPRQYASKEFTALLHTAERLGFLLKDVQESLGKKVELINSCSVSLTYEQKRIIEEMHTFLAELADLKDAVREMMLENSNRVKWVETDSRAPQNATTITMEPAAVGEYLDSHFFKKKKSVVITSATLSVKQSYRFIRNELGLENAKVKEYMIPSPFDYKNQVMLLIADDLPEVNTVSVDDYVTEITSHIISIAETTKGRMLLLFTSHEMLKKTYELIKESGFLNDFAIIAQGITSGSQTRLTRNFQRYEKAILLGTNSFWEGVDIPGEDLSCLVIVRLPFTPPDDPFTEAKSEYVKKQGGNPFLDYSLPEAILRFKQGFGRLIRTNEDKGVMVVFDKRIVSTKYGKAFLQSIPDISVSHGSIDAIIEKVNQWLD